MTALYLFGESFVNFLKIICFMLAGCKGRCCIALWWWQKGPCHQVWVISLTLEKIKLPKKVSSADQCSKLVFVQWVDQPQYNKGSLGTGKICLLQIMYNQVLLFQGSFSYILLLYYWGSTVQGLFYIEGHYIEVPLLIYAWAILWLLFPVYQVVKTFTTLVVQWQTQVSYYF